jgi:glycosyltransferase involved in cell wall biosynthesis
MNVLLINKFFYRRGGSEVSLFLTARALEKHGHRTAFLAMSHPDNLPSPYDRYFVSGVDFEAPAWSLQGLRAAGRVLYSFEARRRLEALIRDDRPDIAHVHNIHHQLTPSIFHTLRRHRIPVVMTLHDYKVVCPAYNLFRDGRPCELCRGGRFYNCLRHKCSKNSRLRSLVNTLEMYLHRDILRTEGLVNVYLSPSRFLGDKVAAMGFRPKVMHLPNALDLDEFEPAAGPGEDRLVYFGRLSPEKGLPTLLDALAGTSIRCLVIGRGPLGDALRERAGRESLNGVSFSDYLSPVDLRPIIRASRAVVVPSEWYENNPYSVLESFALARPVIAARIGGLPELVQDGETGLTFTPGSASELRRRMEDLLAGPADSEALGRRARRFVEGRNGLEAYYEGLMKAYARALEGGA